MVIKALAFLGEFVREDLVLRRFAQDAAVLIHGSLTMGVYDEFADIDCWFLLPEHRLAEFDAVSKTRFIQFECDGRDGHACVHSVEEFDQRLATCYMDTIFQLRRAMMVRDVGGTAARLVAAAQRPMRDAVRRALFLYHYVEMRNEHRSCRSPIERSDPVAVLLAFSKALTHALRAACVLHGEPFPYDKWLHHVARETPTGRAIEPHVQAALAGLAAGALHEPGPEGQHALGRNIRAIRAILIAAAREHGIDEPWLDKWYLHMDAARDAVVDLHWLGEP